MKFEEDIKESIEKNLPQAVGEVLRKRLTEFEQIETNYKSLVTQNESLTKRYDELQKENQSLLLKVKTDEKLKEKEIELEKREIRFELELARKDVEAANASLNVMNNVVGKVFNSPIYRNHVSGNIPFPPTQPNQYNAYPTSTQGFISVTTENKITDI